MITASTGTSSSSSSGAVSYNLIILHTNDVHSHMEGHEPELDYALHEDAGTDNTHGGIARIAAQVATERAAAATASTPLVLLDSGDFTQGTAFGSYLALSHSTELYEMSRMGYDAITLGNHEFDFTSAGTAAIIATAEAEAADAGVPVNLVATNIQIPDDGGATALADVAAAGYLPQFRIETLSNGLTIGYVGIMGANAASVAPLAKPVTFDTSNYLFGNAVASTVSYLRNDAGAQMVIALSHSGETAPYPDGGGVSGEDIDLASQSSGIDIIISGHTHVALPTPVAVPNADGQTVYVVQTGAYGVNLGKMNLTFTPGAGVTVNSYELEPIDDTIAADATVQGRVDGYVADLNALFTEVGAPFQYFSPMGHTGFDLPNTAFVETGLGDLVTDSYLAAANAATYVDGGEYPDGGEIDAGWIPVALAVESNGNLRAPVAQGLSGVLAWADLFNVVPLGVGPDEQPGYPLVTYYLTGADIWAGLQLSSSAANPSYAALGIYDNDYFLQLSGVDYTYDSTQGLFQEVQSVTVDGQTILSTDTSKCFRVVSTLYLEELLSLVYSATDMMLSVVPKQAGCTLDFPDGGSVPNVVTDFDSTILYQPGSAGTVELKNWEAFEDYVGHMPLPPDGGALPELNAAYAAPQGRITGQ